jgi:hypothetical protein
MSGTSNKPKAVGEFSTSTPIAMIMILKNIPYFKNSISLTLI